jgi:putative methyltransferase (TIGR04325 family)
VTPKRILQHLAPPLLWNFGKACKRRLFPSVDYMAYAPRGWSTPLPGGIDRHAYWSKLIERERAVYRQLVSRAQSGEPLLEERTDPTVTVFGYVLALTAHSKQQVSVLDYGGNLGEYYWLARALVPGLTLDYHCKELPAVAASGREINPAVTFHSDDSCFDRSYDLVMFLSSLQYLPDWQDVLRRAVNATGSHLLLCNVPSVKDAATFVATSRSSSVTTLQIQLNRDEVVNTVARAGMGLIRELPMGAHPPIANAPEQPAYTGWLFHR